MKVNISWTPLGCGPYKADDYPDFHGDMLSRLKHFDLGPEALFLAWELTRLASGGMNPGQQRALMLLVLASQLVSAEGSTRLPLEGGGRDLLHRVLEEFNISAEEHAAVEELLVEAQKAVDGSADAPLAQIFGGPGDYRPLLIDHGCLYIQKLHVLEDRVGRNLRMLMDSGMSSSDGEPASGKPDDALENALQEVFNSPPAGDDGKAAALDTEQKKAVRTALSGRIAVVSGRPGSGKTSIVTSVLRVLARIGDPPLESMALAAPTGKAADRMRQSIASHLAEISDPGEADRRLAKSCPPSLTLHRLLGYSPGQDRYTHHENNPLSEQLIVVDESSMVDLAMMDRLLRALRPGARVVFLGDADQLPSIETGAVLRDLCRSATANRLGRVVVLKKSYRAREEDPDGKSILDAAAAINEGTLSDGKPFGARKAALELLFRGVEHLIVGDEGHIAPFFTRWLELLRRDLPDLDERVTREYVSGSTGFDEETARDLGVILAHYEKFRILCVTRATAGRTGSETVNPWFHNRWSDTLRAAKGASENPRFQVGEPVMITRNDYNLRLYNGDSGLVLMVKPPNNTGNRPAELMAVFPRSGSFVAYPLEVLRGRVELAWATTVHKAQGSEYDHVAILLPRTHVRPLTRELLYTAVTRAKKSVVLAGSPEVLATGIKRKMERNSGLSDMLDFKVNLIQHKVSARKGDNK